MNTSELIQPRHLDRRAEIYVRQSSPNQVITNKESQRMQYALRERAATLGWHEQDIQVIDADLAAVVRRSRDVSAIRNSSHRSRSAKSESCWPSTRLDWPATVHTGISC